MHIHILGSGDAFGSGGRAQTCIVVETGGQRLLVDCGATSLPALRRAGITPDSIDAIVITHFHGDHFGGVPWMLLDALHHVRNPRGLRITGPSGVRARVLDTLDLLFAGAGASVEQAIEREALACFTEYMPGVPLMIGNAAITARGVEHSGTLACHGVRVEASGKAFAYSGDTAWTASLVDLANGADLFVAECQAWESAPSGHLSYSEIRQHLHELHARRILLTHMGQEMLERARDLVEPRVSCADDGLQLYL